MKVVHILSGPITSGAAKGALNLHNGLLELGIDSLILTTDKTAKGSRISYLLTHPINYVIFKLSRPIDRFLSRVIFRNQSDVMFSTGMLGLIWPLISDIRDSDIVNFQWSLGLFSPFTLWTLKKPVVVSVRDMWLFTGGCHYPPKHCTKYTSKCGQCPALGSAYSIDLSTIYQYLKRKLLPNRYTYVAISEWMKDEMKQSSVLHGKSIVCIENSINPEHFYPRDKRIARNDIGISPDDFVILIGASNLNDQYKGIKLFIEALHHLPSHFDASVLSFGVSSVSLSNGKIRNLHAGYIDDPDKLAALYSAADVFVCPSLVDAFAKTVVEAMSCQTPVIAFDGTGPASLFVDQLEGLKASYAEPRSLAMQIYSLYLLNKSDRTKMGLHARNKVLNNYSNLRAASQYASLYTSLVRN